MRHVLAFVLLVLLLAAEALAQPITISPLPPRAFGYTIGDRVLRPAMVAVAKKPPANDNGQSSIN